MKKTWNADIISKCSNRIILNLYLHQLELQIEALEKESREIEEKNNEEEHRLRKDKGKEMKEKRAHCFESTYTVLIYLMHRWFAYPSTYMSVFLFPPTLYSSPSIVSFSSTSISTSRYIPFFLLLFDNVGRAESSLNLKITQYDEDMYSRHTALEALKASYAAESAECAVLEGTSYYKKLEAL